MRDIVDDARRRYRPTTAVSPSGCGRRQAVAYGSAAHATPRAELVQRLPRRADASIAVTMLRRRNNAHGAETKPGGTDSTNTHH